MEALADQEQVVLEIRTDVAFLFLGAADAKIPVLSFPRMESLDNALKQVEANSALKGLVIAGAASSGFCAGADVKAIQGVRDPKEGEQLAVDGQRIFGRIAKLPITTVAAIHGACVGGGCELSLACDHRMMLDTDDTKIGLPEVKLGILPGFGGTQRLPRLVGLPKSLELILTGRLVSASRARRMGLADAVVAASTDDRIQNFEVLLREATEVASGKKVLPAPKLALPDRLLTSFGLGRSFVQSKAKAGVMKETKGHYPAPLRALKVAVDGLATSLEAGLAEEARALGELIVTPESKSLVHIYYCTEAASRLGRAAKDEVQGGHIAVLGAGVMGSGIAAAFLAKGFRVSVLDPVAEARDRAQAHVEKSLSRRRSLSDSRRAELLAKFTLTSKMSDLSSADLLIEAIIEDLSIKQEVLSEAASVLRPDAIIASNTSSLSINDLAQGVAGAERVIGMHFFNPAEKMPLVEIIRGAETSDKALAYVAAATSSIGKYPVVVEDVPGFLVNRILSPYIAEAGLLLQAGYDLVEIDKAAVAFGMPMGPFRMLDEVGLDVAAKVQEIMTESYGERMKAPEYPKKLVEHSRRGRKSGSGFYRYNGKDPSPDAAVYALLGLEAPSKAVDPEEVADRLSLALVLEAVRCLDAEVAGVPGADSAGQIDLATVMGMGFAPFRGGVLRYAESKGATWLVERLDAFAKQYGERFHPVDGIVSRANSGKSFYS